MTGVSWFVFYIVSSKNPLKLWKRLYFSTWTKIMVILKRERFINDFIFFSRHYKILTVRCLCLFFEEKSLLLSMILKPASYQAVSLPVDLSHSVCSRAVIRGLSVEEKAVKQAHVTKKIDLCHCHFFDISFNVFLTYSPCGFCDYFPSLMFFLQ